MGNCVAQPFFDADELEAMQGLKLVQVGEYPPTTKEKWISEADLYRGAGRVKILTDWSPIPTDDKRYLIVRLDSGKRILSAQYAKFWDPTLF
jgi:hypothetical protein